MSAIVRRAFSITGLLVIVTALFACGQDQGVMLTDAEPWPAELRVENAYYRLPPPSIDKTAAYLTIYNQSAEDLELISVISPQVRKLELHEIIENNGRMGMRRRDAISVPAGATVALKPGGLHLMLFGIASGPAEEMKPLAVELEFAQAGTTIDGGAVDGAAVDDELNRVQIVKKRLPVSLQPFDMRN